MSGGPTSQHANGAGSGGSSGGGNRSGIRTIEKGGHAAQGALAKQNTMGSSAAERNMSAMSSNHGGTSEKSGSLYSSRR